MITSVLQDARVRRAAASFRGPSGHGSLRWLNTTLLALLAGCSPGEDTARWRGTIDTLSNGAVVVRNEGGHVWDSTTAWRLVEDLRIGTAGEGPASFNRIVTLEVSPDGRIYVVEGQAQEVRVFDSTGGFVRTIGRSGKGPGEFVSANGLAWDPDGRLWVVDQKGERYTLFDAAGRVLETHLRGLAFYGGRWEGAVDTAGRMMEDKFVGGQAVPPNLLLRFDRTFARRDTFPLPWVPQANLRIAYPRGYAVAPVPFSPRFAWLVDPRGYVWFSFGDAYRIVERRLNGDTARIVERTTLPIPVTDAEVDSAVTALVSLVSRNARGADIASQIDRSRIPRTKPPLHGFFLDDAGRLWVVPSVPVGEPGNVLDVFDVDGRYLGRVTLPFPFSSYQPVVIRRDRFYTVTEDADGVPFVVRARIVRGAR